MSKSHLHAGAYVSLWQCYELIRLRIVSETSWFATIAAALTAFDLKVLPGSKSSNHDFQVIQFCQANKILSFDTGARSCQDKMPAKILYPTFEPFQMHL